MNIEGVEWTTDSFFSPASPLPKPELHVVDNMEHESTTAHLVHEAAAKLGAGDVIKVHVSDYYEDSGSYLAEGAMYERARAKRACESERSERNEVLRGGGAKEASVHRGSRKKRVREEVLLLRICSCWCSPHRGATGRGSRKKRVREEVLLLSNLFVLGARRKEVLF